MIRVGKKYRTTITVIAVALVGAAVVQRVYG